MKRIMNNKSLREDAGISQKEKRHKTHIKHQKMRSTALRGTARRSVLVAGVGFEPTTFRL